MFYSRTEREKMTGGDTERWMRKDGERKASNINQVHTGRRKGGWRKAEKGMREGWVGGWMVGREE